MREKGKSLDVLEPSNARFGEVVTVRQQQPLGLGHAVWCARDIVGDEPFAVLLPDELMFGKPNCLAQMVDAYEKVGGNLVAALGSAGGARPTSYGVIDPGATDGRLTEIRGLVEKPEPGTAPSQPDAARPLHPPARRDARARCAGARRRRRDPADRRDGQADRPAALPRATASRASATTAASAAGFVIANLAMALERDDVGPKVRDFHR